ncbi:hypothetical protein PCE1_000366 [Barthelona sp. PCE]
MEVTEDFLKKLTQQFDLATIFSLNLANMDIKTWPQNIVLSECERLDVGYNSLGDLSFLECFPKLKILHAENNRISDISGLIDAPYIEQLFLEGNNLNGIESLSLLNDAGKLRVLNLRCFDGSNPNPICLSETYCNDMKNFLFYSSLRVLDHGFTEENLSTETYLSFIEEIENELAKEDNDLIFQIPKLSKFVDEHTFRPVYVRSVSSIGRTQEYLMRFDQYNEEASNLLARIRQFNSSI